METIPGIDREARPVILYKYLSLRTAADREHALGSLERHQLWFSSRRAFNDPFDSRPAIDLSADKDTKINWMTNQYLKRGVCKSPEEAAARATEVIQETEGKDDRLSQDIESKVQAHLDGIGILCLAATPSSLLMWSHYSDGHRGMCLGYRSCALHDMFDAARTVTYQSSRPAIAAWTDSQETKLKKALLTKGECWSYEEEYRILNAAHCDYLAEHDASNLTSVILGAKIDPAMRESIVKVARGLEPAPRLLQADLARNQFELLHRSL